MNPDSNAVNINAFAAIPGISNIAAPRSINAAEAPTTINMSSSLSCMSLNSPRVANLNAFTTKNINVPRATANNIEPIISCGYFVMIVPPMNMIAPHITISLANSSALSLASSMPLVAIFSAPIVSNMNIPSEAVNPRISGQFIVIYAPANAAIVITPAQAVINIATSFIF